MGAPVFYSYLLAYSDGFGSAEEVQALLDAHPNVHNWYRCLPHAIFLVSEASATTLSESLTKMRGLKKGRALFIILDTATDRNGLLPKQAWSFMRTPRRVGS